MRCNEHGKPTATAAEGFCPEREDETHCEHWWDGDSACCNCGFEEVSGSLLAEPRGRGVASARLTKSPHINAAKPKAAP